MFYVAVARKSYDYNTLTMVLILAETSSPSFKLQPHADSGAPGSVLRSRPAVCETQSSAPGVEETP